MNVLIVATGSTGTIEPCLQLAERLINSGKSVKVIGCEDFVEIAAQRNIQYFSDGLPLKKWLNWEYKGGPLEHRIFSTVTDDLLSKISEICENVDLVISTIFYSGVALSLSEHYGLELKMLCLFPCTFTGDDTDDTEFFKDIESNYTAV